MRAPSCDWLLGNPIGGPQAVHRFSQKVETDVNRTGGPPSVTHPIHGQRASTFGPTADEKLLFVVDEELELLKEIGGGRHVFSLAFDKEAVAVDKGNHGLKM
jgi:hypothetical protein